VSGEQLKDKVAIVTGGASGIGLGIARLFTRERSRVALVDLSEERGAAAAKAIADKGGEVIFIRADVTSSAQVAQGVKEIVQRLGPPDILVNNAAIRIIGKVTDITEGEWDRVIDTDLKGLFLFSKECIPLMAARGGGVIVNISSGSAYGRPERAAYCAAKAGVIGLTRAMSLDHRNERIRVNCVVPAFTLSGMTEDSPPEVLAAQAKKSVAGRVATPEDVAAAALFLCSDAAVTITGAVLEMSSP